MKWDSLPRKAGEDQAKEERNKSQPFTYKYTMPFKHARDLKPKDMIRYANGKIGEVESVSNHRVCFVHIKTTTGGNVGLQYENKNTQVYVMEEKE